VEGIGQPFLGDHGRGRKMHELGIVIKVVKTVEAFAKGNGVEKIDTLVLQIGAMSSIVPQYIQACYPAAVEGTMLKDTKLKIERLPGAGQCTQCDETFNPLESSNHCPRCGSRDWRLLRGKEFMIKEIVAY